MECNHENPKIEVTKADCRVAFEFPCDLKRPPAPTVRAPHTTPECPPLTLQETGAVKPLKYTRTARRGPLSSTVHLLHASIWTRAPFRSRIAPG